MGTTPQYQQLIKRAKALKISTVDELWDLIGDEFSDEKAPITGADFEIAKKQLRLRENMKNKIKTLIRTEIYRMIKEDANNLLTINQFLDELDDLQSDIASASNLPQLGKIHKRFQDNLMKWKKQKFFSHIANDLKDVQNLFKKRQVQLAESKK